jgi:DNA repair ATPase RecN
MSDTKMLQAILDGQVLIHKDLKRVEKKVDGNGQRIDKLGIQLAELEDDTPTREEHDNLGQRVGKLEDQVASA